jgi:hypothetical protein
MEIRTGLKVKASSMSSTVGPVVCISPARNDRCWGYVAGNPMPASSWFAEPLTRREELRQ